jgi:hypothetical protein
MLEQITRKRGGQKGNRNALKHGYYSRIFSKEEKADFCSAGDVEGIDEEIALMRHVIKTTASKKDDKHLLLLVRAANALNKLIRTRQKIQGRYSGLKEAIEKVVREVNPPMGINIGRSIITKRIPGTIETDSPE